MNGKDMTWMARVALAALTGLWAWRFLGTPVQGVTVQPGMVMMVAHAAAGYAIGLSAFLAFPTSRRHDLCLSLIVLAAIAEGASALALSQIHVLGAGADAAGLVCAYLPAASEDLRRRIREAPLAPVGARSGRERRAAPRRGLMSQLVASPAAWLLLAGLAFATLCPIGLRPRLGDVQLERFGAFFVTAGAFVAAYPRRPLTVALFLAAAAVGLELGQLLVPGRDAGVEDVAQKAGGALVGAASAWAALSVAGSWARERRDVRAQRGAQTLPTAAR